MSTGECINRLVALEGQVSLLRHQLSVEGKWRRRIESWLCRRFDYEAEPETKDEEGGDCTGNYDKGRNGREVDDDDGYEGSDSKVNAVAAALKEKRRLSSQSDEYHHDHYDVVEVDDDDISQEECEDLSPKRFKIHHPPPPLQKRPDVPLRWSNDRTVNEDNRVTERVSHYRKKQEVFIETDDYPEDEADERRSSDEILWRDSEEVEVINVEPCLDIEFDEDDGEGNQMQEQWETNNGYSGDEDETVYDDAYRKVGGRNVEVVYGDSYTNVLDSNFKSTASKKYAAQEKHNHSQENGVMVQTLNLSGPPKLIAMKHTSSTSGIKQKSLNQRPVSSIPSTSHSNSLLKNSSPTISLKGSSTVVSLSEVYAQAKIDRNRLQQWNQVKPGLARVQTADGSSVKPGVGGLLKKSTTYEQLQNRSILDMSAKNKQPGECPHCGKTFNTPAEMMRHTRIHTGEKPYKCYACTYATSFNGDLVRHLKSRHPGMDPYVCHLCDFKCQELLMFNNHRRKTGHGGRGSSTLNIKDSYPTKAESSYAESENF